MDLHARWLRDYVVGRIAARLTVEGALVSAATAVVLGLLTTTDTALIAVAATLAGLVAAGLRLGAAIAANPLNHRFLLGWRDETGRLTVLDDTGRPPQPHDGSLARMSLQPMSRLGVEAASRTVTDAGLDRPAADTAPEPTLAFELYASPSQLVLVAIDVERDQAVALSRLSDGRVLVTARELVAPHAETLINTPPPRRGPVDDPLPDLVIHHVERLDQLQTRGVIATPAGHDLLVDQLRLEWQAWQQLGALVGPLIAVGDHRQPHLLLVAPPRQELWDRAVGHGVDRIARHRFVGPVPTAGATPRRTEITVDVPAGPRRRIRRPSKAMAAKAGVPTTAGAAAH